MRLLIRNGSVVCSHNTGKSDVLTEDGVIRAIRPEIDEPADEVIDAA